METSTTLNVAIWKRVVFHDQLWLVCLTFFLRYAFELVWMQGRDCISHGVYEISPCQQGHFYPSRGCTSSDCMMSTSSCQLHSLEGFNNPAPVGLVEKNRLSFIQDGFDNPTTKGGGILSMNCSFLRISDPSKSILEKYKLDLRPPSISGKFKGLRGDSPGGDSYWMGGG